jgi:hypothetical protein
MIGLLTRPLGLLLGAAMSIGVAYMIMAAAAYVFGGGLDHPAAGHAAVADVTRTMIGFWTAVIPGLINLGQAIVRAVMNALQA